jgi:dipeptidase E
LRLFQILVFLSIKNSTACSNLLFIPHYNNPGFQDACGLNAEKWAAKIPASVYPLDEQTAIKVVAGQVEVVSEGQWKVFSKPA